MMMGCIVRFTLQAHESASVGGSHSAGSTSWFNYNYMDVSISFSSRVAAAT